MTIAPPLKYWAKKLEKLSKTLNIVKLAKKVYRCKFLTQALNTLSYYIRGEMISTDVTKERGERGERR
jgi:hypothetical protein